MITLSPEIHGHWGLGNFMLEPVEEAMNSYEQNLRFKWVPQRRSSGSIHLLSNSNGLDVMEVEPEMLINCRQEQELTIIISSQSPLAIS